MKTKYWIMLLALVALVLGILAFVLIPREQAQAVEIWSEGKLLYTLPLNANTSVEITTERGTNTVVIRDGKAWVERADCPDGICARQGKRQRGQIVCLPNRLVLKFTGSQIVDGISG